jgi:hypothetical protein
MQKKTKSFNFPLVQISYLLSINKTMLDKIIGLILLVVCTSGKLYQVVSMFRHGARYHLNHFYDYNATKDLWGELTAVGMKMHERLGGSLRKDYIESLGFLSSDYQES